MTVLSQFYVGAVGMLALLALFFIFCRHYEEGVVGNAALGVMFVMALGELGDIVRPMFDRTAAPWDAPQPGQAVLVIAIALFLARYAAKVVWKNWVERFWWARRRGTIDFRM